MTNRSRAWCITINNETVDDLLQLLDLETRYMSFGFEEGDKKHTPHIQGYVYFDNPRTFNQMQENLPRAHISVAYGSACSNEQYTCKEEDQYTFGDPPQQGKLTYEMIESVMVNPDLNIQLFHQYRKTYSDIVQAKAKNADTTLHSCKYYVLFENFGIIEDCTEYFGEIHDFAILFNLSELELYPDTKKIIWKIDIITNIQQVSYYPRGAPIYYKNGYQMIRVIPEIFVVVVNVKDQQRYLEKAGYTPIRTLI